LPSVLCEATSLGEKGAFSEKGDGVMGTTKRLGYPRAAAIFLGFTAYFYLLVLFLIPWLKSNFVLNPALLWFITGYCRPGYYRLNPDSAPVTGVL